MDYRCPHRGAQLHLGWVEGDALRCLYHGWKFDCSGQCIEMPRGPELRAQGGARSYPTQECMGSSSRTSRGAPRRFRRIRPRRSRGSSTSGTPRRAVQLLQCYENSATKSMSPSCTGRRLALGDRRAALDRGRRDDWGMLRLGKRKGGKVR